MVVLILERVSASFRGFIARWLVEPKAGVFVGKVPASVREALWRRASIGSAGGAATLIYQTNTEQGFAIRTAGEGSREFVDFDGLWLVRWPASS